VAATVLPTNRAEAKDEQPPPAAPLGCSTVPRVAGEDAAPSCAVASNPFRVAMRSCSALPPPPGPTSRAVTPPSRACRLSTTGAAPVPSSSKTSASDRSPSGGGKRSRTEVTCPPAVLASNDTSSPSGLCATTCPGVESGCVTSSNNGIHTASRTPPPYLQVCDSRPEAPGLHSTHCPRLLRRLTVLLLARDGEEGDAVLLAVFTACGACDSQR